MKVRQDVIRVIFHQNPCLSDRTKNVFHFKMPLFSFPLRSPFPLQQHTTFTRIMLLEESDVIICFRKKYAESFVLMKSCPRVARLYDKDGKTKSDKFDLESLLFIISITFLSNTELTFVSCV